jgi:hypothetical protein
MALFTDGTISTLEELRGYESAIYDVATTERIDLSQKLLLAQQELGIELTSRFFRETPEGLNEAVVTPALQSWHLFQTLALIYRDAYNSHFNDRYLGKWREYERLAKWACRHVLDMGVGMVGEPVPKAQPPVAGVAAGAAGAATYWIRVAWTGRSGEEGCASDPSVVSSPQGMVPTAEAVGPPPNATGWNVYAGLALDDTRLQNASPISAGASWVMGPSGLVAGKPAGKGQTPSFYKRIERVLQRG